MANGDAKRRERLERFADPLAVTNWAFEADKKIASGVLKKTLSENPSPEELASYRKEIGLPEKFEEYPIAPPKDITLSDADKPVLDLIKKVAHDNAIDPKAVQKLADAWFANRELAIQDFNEHAANAVQDRIVQLRTEWGNDYTQNVKLGDAFLAEMLGDKAPELTRIQLADGTVLGSHPDFVRLVAQAARNYGSGDLHMPQDSGGAGGEARMNEIKKLMADDRSEYWRGPKAKELQAEYLRLIERQQRKGSRAA